MRKRKFVRIGAVVLAIIMPVLTGITALADDEETEIVPAAVGSYESPDINEMTGAGRNIRSGRGNLSGKGMV